MTIQVLGKKNSRRIGRKGGQKEGEKDRQTLGAHYKILNALVSWHFLNFAFSQMTITFS